MATAAAARPVSEIWRPELLWATAVAAVVALAAGLRFYHLGARSFWYDEGLSVAFAQLPPAQFVALLREREINMSLYYALLRGWLAWGHLEAAVRALSAIAGVLTIAVVYQAGKRLWDRQSGALASLLLALNAFHLRYSQEARSYALAALLVTLATLLLLRAVEERKIGRWRWYALCAAAALYAHVFAALVIAAHAAWLAMRRDRSTIHGARQAALLVVLATVPLAAAALGTGTAPIGWVRPTTPAVLWQFAKELCGNSAAAAVACTVLWSWGAARARGKQEASLVWLWLAMPVVAALVVSVYRPVFEPRYLFVCVPAAALATAGAVRTIPRRGLRLGGAALVVLLTAARTASAYGDPMGSIPQDFRGATAFVLREARPGDALFFYPDSSRGPYEVYRDGRAGPEALVPAFSPDYLNYVYHPLAEELPQGSPAYRRVIFFHVEFPQKGADMGEDVVRAWLRGHYRLERARHFENVDVRIYGR